MDEATARKAVDLLMGSGDGRSRWRIVFFGGEPIVNLPVLQSTVLYAEVAAKAKGGEVQFHLITNATLIEPELSYF
jgi:uncharacterized protein